MNCIICQSKELIFFKKLEHVDYYECGNCESIFADKNTMLKSSQNYTLDYWKKEMTASKERSYGVSLALCAEVFILSSIPIEYFLDIGSGPGFFLDAVTFMMPKYKKNFYGIEKFPPPEKYISKHLNYLEGDISKLKSLKKKISGGICVEVIEHLYPETLESLVENLSHISQEGALYIFNSGQPKYVKEEDPSYLDPYERGHIVSYSIKAIEIIFNKYDFQIMSIPGRTYAFIAEYKSERKFKVTTDSFSQLIWGSLEENLKKLKDNEFGPLMYLLGLHSLRTSVDGELVKERTEWALNLNEQLKQNKKSLNFISYNGEDKPQVS
jgi:hypothetical protein